MKLTLPTILTALGLSACLALLCLGPASVLAAENSTGEIQRSADASTNAMARLMRESTEAAEAASIRAPAAQATPRAQQVEPAHTAPLKPTPVRSTAREQAGDSVHITDKDYLLGYAENGWRIVSGPLRFTRQDWLNAAIVIGATGAFLLADEELNSFWQDDMRSSGTDDASDILGLFGEDTTVAVGALGAYALAETLGAEREKTAALLVLQTFLLTAPVVGAVKYSAGRERPNESGSAYNFDGPGERGFDASFPSGHASYAFGAATVISDVYGEANPWVPWLTYTLATGVALSRVNDNEHWASDVFAGGAIGYLIAKLVTRYSPFMTRHQITARPLLKDGATGVTLAQRF